MLLKQSVAPKWMRLLLNAIQRFLRTRLCEWTDIANGRFVEMEKLWHLHLTIAVWVRVTSLVATAIMDAEAREIRGMTLCVYSKIVMIWKRRQTTRHNDLIFHLMQFAKFRVLWWWSGSRNTEIQKYKINENFHSPQKCIQTIDWLLSQLQFEITFCLQ